MGTRRPPKRRGTEFTESTGFKSGTHPCWHTRAGMRSPSRFLNHLMQKNSRDALIAILCGGIIAATIDIFAASIMYSRSPAYIMQSIAGGLLGKATFDGGMGTTVLGAILQEVMGILIAAIYVVVSKPLPALRGRWILSGLAYGVVIYFVMGYVVLPLSAWKATPHFMPVKFIKEVPAMLLFGLIVTFFCRRLDMSVHRAQDGAANAAY